MAADSSSNSQSTEANRSKRYCCCLSISGSQSISGWWQKISRQEDRWWGKGVRVAMKLREWSELVAGPRWKTFIRRFNRSRSVNGGGRSSVPFRLNYDPLSYTLNFEEQNGQMDVEEYYGGSRDFSARYAAVPKGGS